MTKKWEAEFDELWDRLFPARDGIFLKGSTPRFPVKKYAIKKLISTQIQQAEERMRERAAAIVMGHREYDRENLQELMERLASEISKPNNYS